MSATASASGGVEQLVEKQLFLYSILPKTNHSVSQNLICCKKKNCEKHKVKNLKK